jgi:AraC-like DNA-binding protein
VRFTSVKPTALLAEFVDNFWFYESSATGTASQTILPTGTIELAINLSENELTFRSGERNDRFSGAVVSGAHGKGFTTGPEPDPTLIGVHFKPGGAFPFLGVPAHELADTHIDLETLWGASARRLRDQLCEASTIEERFQILQETLIQHLFCPLEHHYAVSTALEFIGQKVDATVRDLARSLGLSERRLIQVFKAEVGVTPKLFSRVQRFQRARGLVHRLEKAADWGGIAFDCGYFDQSHLIRDFQEFAGLSPAAYFRQYNHILDGHAQVKRYHLKPFSKLSQFYPIQVISGDDIVSLGGDYVGK